MFFQFPEDFKKRVMESDPESEFWLIWGERIMLSYSKIEPNSKSPLNRHPHEQAGIVIEGELKLTIGKETRILKKGDAFNIPGNVEHKGETGNQQTIIVEVFSPPREDYIKDFNADVEIKEKIK